MLQLPASDIPSLSYPDDFAVIVVGDAHVSHVDGVVWSQALLF